MIRDFKVSPWKSGLTWRARCDFFSLFTFCLLAAVIGTRLHAAVAIACVVMAFYVLFIKWIPKHPSHQRPTKGMKVKNLSGACAQRRRVQLKSSKSPGWHHSICPYHMWGKLLMVTNIIYASGDSRKPISFMCKSVLSKKHIMSR